MRRTPFLLAGTLSLCLVAWVGLTGCGTDEEDVIIDVGLACSESLLDFNSQACRDSAESRVDDLKDCVMDCGPADDECLEDCLNASGSAFSECTGDIRFLFSGACGDCPVDCAFEFVGDESDPGCLMDPRQEGIECLDALYDCVNEC